MKPWRSSKRFYLVAGLLAATWVSLFVFTFFNRMRQSGSGPRSYWRVFIVEGRNGTYLSTDNAWPRTPGERAVILQFDDCGMNYTGSVGQPTVDERSIRLTGVRYGTGSSWHSMLPAEEVSAAAATLAKLIPDDPARLAEFHTFAEGLTLKQVLLEGHTGGKIYHWSGLWAEVPYSLFAATGCWAPFAIVTIPILLLWRRTTRSGHCDACGYDLVGLKGAVCPECGAVTQ